MAQTKTVNGSELPASAFLYVPDANDPSTWKLPVKDASGEPNLGRVAAAAAALSPRGFRGNKADIPKEAVADVKRRLVGFYKRLGKEKTDIPAHLYEQKSEDLVQQSDSPCTTCNDDDKAAIGGTLKSIQETEYKGRRGLAVEAILNSLRPDSYRDHVVLTPELKASTERYFNTHPLSMVQHGKPYRSSDGKTILPPVDGFLGFTIDRSYEDDGIHIHDFVPEPVEATPQRLKDAYNELKAGEFNGVSVNGWFYRDTGRDKPPGIIIDWDLIEHSYCRNCVDQEASIIGIAELKSKPDDEAQAIWNDMSQETIHSELATQFAEFKAEIEGPSAEPAPEAEVTQADPPKDQPDAEPDTLATVTPPEPGALSGMDLYRSNEAASPVAPTAPSSATYSGYTPATDYVAPAQPPVAVITPVSTPVQVAPKSPTITQAVDESPAPLIGGTMNDTVQAPSGQNVTESDLIKQLLADVEAMKSEKKALELQADQERRDKEAREIAESTARQIAEAAAAQEAEQKSKVEKYTQEALARYQISPVGGRLSLPVGAGSAPASSGSKPRFTMAGPVVEEKARSGDDGKALPSNMIDWIMDVKAGKRQAQFLSWTEKFGSEAKAVSMGVPGAQTNSPAGSAGGFALPVQYLEEIVPLLIDQFSIRSLISTYPANSILLEVPRMATRAARAVVTAEGDTKPKRQFGTDMIAIRLYTIPQIVDVTNQLLNFSRETAEQIVREQMADAIRLAEFFYALQGTGTNEPYGLIPALIAADAADATKHYVIEQASGTQPTGAAVPNTETLPDVIARAINVTQLRYYDPDALLVHPNVWWKLITTKDSYGRYLVDANMTGTINSVWGIRVVHTTQIPMGKAVVGNWKKLRMYIAQDVTVDVTNEAGDRWDKNLTGFRIEEMIGLDARQELDAFTCIDFTTAGVASS